MEVLQQGNTLKAYNILFGVKKIKIVKLHQGQGIHLIPG